MGEILVNVSIGVILLALINSGILFFFSSVFDHMSINSFSTLFKAGLILSVATIATAFLLKLVGLRFLSSSVFVMVPLNTIVILNMKRFMNGFYVDNSTGAFYGAVLIWGMYKIISLMLFFAAI